MLRVWGRVGQVNGVGGVWTAVTTTPSGDSSNCYLTALCQTLKLARNESPFWAQSGIGGAQAVMSQIAPDFDASQVQTFYAPFFASLIISRVLGVNPPSYAVQAVCKSGAVLSTVVAT